MTTICSYVKSSTLKLVKMSWLLALTNRQFSIELPNLIFHMEWTGQTMQCRPVSICLTCILGEICICHGLTEEYVVAMGLLTWVPWGICCCHGLTYLSPMRNMLLPWADSPESHEEYVVAMGWLTWVPWGICCCHRLTPCSRLNPPQSPPAQGSASTQHSHISKASALGFLLAIGLLFQSVFCKNWKITRGLRVTLLNWETLNISLNEAAYVW